MKIEAAVLSKIQFKRCAHPKTLEDSLKRIGLSFPIHVRKLRDGYQCVDGAKCLSATQQILKEDPAFHKFQSIRILVVETVRTAPPHHLHNHH